MDENHERITRVALAAGRPYGLALAGGYAVQAHGIGSRPSGDVDLFTSWRRRDEFPDLVTAVIDALEEAGYTTSIGMRGETFVRVMVTDPVNRRADKVEISADWRAHDPIQLDIGPVLHADDAVANKMCALFGRAMPRDFLDVDAAITSGRYTREQLLNLAAQTDPGFDRLIFADALGALTQITDTAFAEYDTKPEAVADLRRRFAERRHLLLANQPQ
ncbi:MULTISPECIES: nucleotidyl transferase AbiEii/AbiGii toxin family protein [unclassified Frankia]|uniref:nucleotidyl transferase AbiEii/AbiGii toxin family protein n=1 Tax=unclassified Frankia TaxID=2632575 RepID=UPI001EF4F65C|nr:MULTISPECIES: nucleotidyl transferase AbiEii/AbiGii toxin family protein [unclassified Frankia]